MASPAVQRPQIAMLLYPGFTLLDLAGPMEVLAPHADVHLVWKTLEPVQTDGRASLLPTVSLGDCPQDLDVLFCPGGAGTAEVLDDETVLEFLADRGSRSRYVTSVCTGSLILAAAGLLDGYRTTCHWMAHDLLRLTRAIPVKERVVRDRNRMSGGGVTAGIDFGLTLLAELFDDRVAKRMQLALEYDPAPPYDAGTPERPDASQEDVDMIRSWTAPLDRRMESSLRRRFGAIASSE